MKFVPNTCCVVLFSWFLAFLYIHKGVIIGIKLNIRNMSSVTMLKHIIFTKDLVIIFKACPKCLILPPQVFFVVDNNTIIIHKLLVEFTWNGSQDEGEGGDEHQPQGRKRNQLNTMIQITSLRIGYLCVKNYRFKIDFCAIAKSHVFY